ncbi:MAG: hypothetical protein ACRDYE_15695 [Acidimicrobiales bacterium]
MPKPPDIRTIDELLDEALEGSFPASDPLSFWSGRDPRAGGEGEVPEPARRPDDDRVARAREQ